MEELHPEKKINSKSGLENETYERGEGSERVQDLIILLIHER